MMRVIADVRLVEGDGRNSPCHECLFEHLDDDDCPSDLCDYRYFFERTGDWEIIDDETDD